VEKGRSGDGFSEVPVPQQEPPLIWLVVSLFLSAPQRDRNKCRLPTARQSFTYLMEKRVAEFFAGIGLMRMGLDRAGWRTVWVNDIDEKKREMCFCSSDPHPIV